MQAVGQIYETDSSWATRQASIRVVLVEQRLMVMPIILRLRTRVPQ